MPTSAAAERSAAKEGAREGGERIPDADTPFDATADPDTGTGTSGREGRQNDTRTASGSAPAAHDARQPGTTGSTPAVTLIAAPDGTLRLAPAGFAAVAAPGLPSADDAAANIERLVGSMRVLVRDQVSQATIRLRPQHFGDVTIDLRVDGKSVTATVQTDSPQVREWLQSQEATLRANLEAQGLQLERLHVSRDPRQARREPHQQQEPRRQRRRDEAHQGTFEIAV